MTLLRMLHALTQVMQIAMLMLLHMLHVMCTEQQAPYCHSMVTCAASAVLNL